jgi:mRNA interferase YafQ
MRILRWTGAFTKDVKRLAKRGYDLNKLQRILHALQEGDALPPPARPHLLSGEWAGAWDCHVSGNWVLIYELTEDEVQLLPYGNALRSVQAVA